MTDLCELFYRPPWLTARFSSARRMLSWSLNRPGFVESDTVAWLQVVNADLPLGVDPLELLERRLLEEGLEGAVGLMTARDLAHHHVARSDGPGGPVEATVTLGLSNGIALDRNGGVDDARRRNKIGTINLLVAVSTALEDGAMLEAMSIATVARTAALLADGRGIVATGTDCIVVASRIGSSRERHCGLHTETGRRIASVVFRATMEAKHTWERDVPSKESSA